MWYILFLISVVITIILATRVERYPLDNIARGLLILNLIIWVFVLAVLPILLSYLNVSEVITKREFSNYRKVCRIKNEVYILDNQYNKINITEGIKIVGNQDTQINIVNINQVNWFVDQLVIDIVGYSGVVNIKDIEEVIE